MNQRGDDGGLPLFVHFRGRGGSVPGDRVLSRAALRLHVYAVLASIEAGRPGLVTDDYLDAVRAETSMTALELCTVGLWTRVEDGYEVAEGETLRMATEVHRQLEELAARCRASGGHVPDPEYPSLCQRCAVRLDSQT